MPDTNKKAARAGAAGETTVNTTGCDYTSFDCDVITIVRDEENPLGKHFELKPDGKVEKNAVVTIKVGRAVQRSVKTHADLKQILEEVSEDHHAAIINAGFKVIPIGKEFFILSEKVLSEKLKTDDRSKLVGVHSLPHKKHGQVLVCGRLKENVTPSSWQLLDRDIDEHTPEQYGEAMSYPEWIEVLDTVLPGLAQTTIVRAASTSARVLDTFSGLPVGGGNGHTWIKVSEPTDIERIRSAIMLRSIAQGLAWKKPRFSRATGEVVGHSWTTLVDASVWTPGRLVFNGKPTAEGDLEIAEQHVQIIEKEHPVLDLSAVELPPVELVERKASERGCAVKVRQSDKGLRVDQFNLLLTTELDTEDHGTLSVKEALTKEGKVRCQAPFRSSESFAAFLGKSEEGRPFVHDVGTATNHWLGDDDWAAHQSELKIASAKERHAALLDWRAQIQAAADEFGVREVLCKQIATDDRLTPNNRDALAVDINVKLGRLAGNKPGIGHAKKLIAPPRVAQLEDEEESGPNWLKGWYYVTDRDQFFRYDSDEWLTMQGFNSKYSRKIPPGDEGGRIPATVFALEVHPIPTVTRGMYLPCASATFTESGTKYVNTFRPSSVPKEAARLDAMGEAVVELVKQHILALVNGRVWLADLLLDWIAHNVQNPGVKIRFSFVIQGIEGDGKTMIGDLIGRIMGQVNVHIISPEVVSKGDFNGWAEGYCVGVLEELRLQGNNRFDVLNSVKPCVTNANITIHRKRQDPYNAVNTMNYIAFTNHKDALPLDDTDRRWVVVFAPWENIGQFEQRVGCANDVYFDRLFTALDQGATYLRRYFLDRDLTQFNRNSRAPDTEEKRVMVSLGVSDELTTARDLIAEGGYGFGPEVVSTRELNKAMEVAGVDVPKSTAMKRMMTKLGFQQIEGQIKWDGYPHRVWTRQAVTEPDAIRRLLDATASRQLEEDFKD